MEFLGPVDGVGVRPDGSYGSFAHRVEVQPTDLRFRLVLGRQQVATIFINNPLKFNPVAFKVKTTAREKYCVQPSCGIVEAHSRVRVQVTMKALEDLPCNSLTGNNRDKFLVLVTPMEKDETLGKHTFDKEVRRDIQEHRLPVILESPNPQPQRSVAVA
uniref:MSP domain-containing protein n=1 Tax=Dunaliella tertiolecta TaxID=3047 RepID=A0A7S3R2C2_DUNTE